MTRAARIATHSLTAAPGWPRRRCLVCVCRSDAQFKSSVAKPLTEFKEFRLTGARKRHAPAGEAAATSTTNGKENSAGAATSRLHHSASTGGLKKAKVRRPCDDNAMHAQLQSV